MKKWAVVEAIPQCKEYPDGYSDTLDYFETEQQALDYIKELKTAKFDTFYETLISMNGYLFVDFQA